MPYQAEMSGPAQRPRLRTKTGCLTCKNRRKKCDEERPACHRCRYSGYTCQWPTTDDLIDRRYSSHPARRKSTSPAPSTATAESNDTQQLSISRKDQYSDNSVTDATVSRSSEAAAHQLLCHDLESVLARHFVDRYYALLLLPSCHPEYYHGWINEIQELMLQHKCLRSSVLACAASHLHFVDASPQMQELSLTYYSAAIRGLSEVLARASSQLENHNGLLMSIILLYLHGCMGRGTYNDIPRHVNAAIRILKLRLMERPLSTSISRPFDRLAVESVLYQVFLVTMGSWCGGRLERVAYTFDAAFWLRAENLLAQSMLFRIPSTSISTNSPVLGVPLDLFKLVLSIKRLWESPFGQLDAETLDELRTELEEWERTILGPPQSPSDSNYEIYRDATALYVLVASLLVQQLQLCEGGGHAEGIGIGPPGPVPPGCWQIEKAMIILQNHEHDVDWARCYIGNWPVYTLGFFVATPEDIQLVRDDMRRRWNLMRFSQLERFRNDLEATWTQRNGMSCEA
ncbi:hypothetical protein A1O7_04175 [Cladophialophora yegresii CBS 114405]|uniref:Zn(2)-C6 fungal-type domain-containing protein n=1 Tax=Cladophialophora yegresii CBS 114405 TaxID=1182544 RepID=W9W673_9EURO|nr:uncharacterized protein A1O7_04175 [Cladophialophora yegresii CBS 114405]EXJ60026.1 hypothetical protein A1O7_04175 [Cladophialophora yegresii CBS 114405]